MKNVWKWEERATDCLYTAVVKNLFDRWNPALIGEVIVDIRHMQILVPGQIGESEEVWIGETGTIQKVLRAAKDTKCFHFARSISWSSRCFWLINHHTFFLWQFYHNSILRFWLHFDFCESTCSCMKFEMIFYFTTPAQMFCINIAHHLLSSVT